MGIEPTRPAWKAGVLPLNYTRILPDQAFLVVFQAYRSINDIYYTTTRAFCQALFLYFFHLSSTLCNFTYLFFLCCFILFTITSLNKKPTIPATRATPSTTSATVKLPLFTLLPKIVESIIAGSLQGMT